MRRCAKRESALLSAGAPIPTREDTVGTCSDLLIKMKAWSTLQGLGIAPMTIHVITISLPLQECAFARSSSDSPHVRVVSRFFLM